MRPLMVLLPYSASSYLMRDLTAFRNLHGKEENWPAQAIVDQTPTPCSLQIKRVFAEVGFGVVALSAAVEIVVYGALMVISMSVYPISKRPAQLFYVLMESSSASVEWAIKNFYLNFRVQNLPTHEPQTEMRSNLIKRELLIQLLIQKVDRLKLLRNQLAVIVEKRRSLKCPVQGWNLLTTILQRPENAALLTDLKNEISPVAIELLSFLTIVECILTNEQHLGLVSQKTQGLLKTENSDFEDDALNFFKKYKNHLTLASYSQFKGSKFRDTREKEVFLKIQSISWEALMGSHLFGYTLCAYLETPY
jgi:hypothetical protein